MEQEVQLVFLRIQPLVNYTEVMKALLSRFLSQFATGCKNSVNVR